MATGTATVTDMATAMDMAAMTRRRAEPRCLAFAAAAWAMAAHAQQGLTAAPAGSMIVQPRIGVMQTWTDNLRLQEHDKDAALITTLSPGIRILSNSGSLRGSVDYTLNGIAYLKSDQPARFQNSLVANAQAELISRTLFVDMRANIGQQNASAFGQQSAPTLGSQGAVNNLANQNQHETGTLAIAPSLRGMLGGVATYDLRSEFTRTEARGTSLGDSRGSSGTLRIDQWNAGMLGWWLQANTQQVKPKTARSNRSETLKAGVNYRPDPDWFFTLDAGRERNDFLGSGTQDGPTGGVTAEWTPTPRTRMGANWQYHDYGNSHGLTFEHRMARSVWRFADMSTTTLGNTGAPGGVRTYYDQFFLLFASVEPDPVQRDIRVRQELQRQGLSPDAPLANGFLSTGPSRLRSQQLGVTLQGVRSSLSAQLSRSITRRLGSNLNQGDLANTSRVEQRSYALTASHQLTPLSGVSLTASRQESTGDFANQAIQLTSWIASWNARLGPRLNGQLGARHSRFEGAAPYTENAVYANLTQLF
ncbi:TIGR03016 family PEP-CTERM system-associated outer membrane protein [Pelomonas sp. Root1444]|uniref:TIGR03016 family PEP-CTERM system-associated outer membrane protein n=1 Tax=Pelomonas sp. Root1444 TaxID=1736464 RepID=UPI00138F715D|nr:TIGR03016 family PEP-CTERM system-associated outer membrane protein [Pelomonas sp. Root1444]